VAPTKGVAFKRASWSILARPVRFAWALLVLLPLCACARDEAPIDAAKALVAFASADAARIEACLAGLRAWSPQARTSFLVENLVHADRGVREWSAHALGEFAPREERVVDALMRAFEDKDDWVRWKAARALGLLGPFARKALPLLESTANAEQEVEVVRAASQVAVRQIRAR
jgi:HEAT repeat protein